MKKVLHPSSKLIISCVLLLCLFFVRYSWSAEVHLGPTDFRGTVNIKYDDSKDESAKEVLLKYFEIHIKIKPLTRLSLDDVKIFSKDQMLYSYNQDNDKKEKHILGFFDIKGFFFTESNKVTSGYEIKFKFTPSLKIDNESAQSIISFYSKEFNERYFIRYLFKEKKMSIAIEP